MSTNVLESLPPRLLPYDTINSFEKNEKIVQSVPVRGFYTNNGNNGAVFQFLLNIPGRGLVAFHRDPFTNEAEWEIVFDSEELGPEEVDDSSHLYELAHRTLLDYSPDLEAEGVSYFEHTPQDINLGLMDYPERPDPDED